MLAKDVFFAEQNLITLTTILEFQIPTFLNDELHFTPLRILMFFQYSFIHFQKRVRENSNEPKVAYYNSSSQAKDLLITLSLFSLGPKKVGRLSIITYFLK